MRRAKAGATGAAVRIGLTVAADVLRAVAVKGELVRWAGEAELAAGESLDSAVATLLRHSPRTRWRRPVVVVAIGPARAQVRRLDGLPPVTDPDATSALIRENASRFFLRDGIPLVTSQVTWGADGAAWAAAFERTVIEDVERGCMTAAVRLLAVVPFAALHGLVADGTARHQDGDVIEEIAVADGRMLKVTRRRSGRTKVGTEVRNADQSDIDDRDQRSAAFPEALACLGEQAPRFMHAYRAALLPHRATELSVSGSRDRVQAGIVPAWRLRLAGVGAVVSLLVLLLVAPARNALHAGDGQRQLDAMAGRRADAVRAQAELLDVTRALLEVRALQASDVSALPILALVASGMPEGSAVQAAELESAGASLVVLTSSTAGVLAGLESIPGVLRAEILGAVTRERMGEREIERATVRVVFDRPPSTSARAAGGLEP